MNQSDYNKMIKISGIGVALPSSVDDNDGNYNAVEFLGGQDKVSLGHLIEVSVQAKRDLGRREDALDNLIVLINQNVGCDGSEEHF